MTYNQKALNKYQSVDVHSSIDQASPHRLIAMLFDGALTAIARAKGLMEQKNFARKSEQINKVTDIVIHLQSALDHEKGGEVAANLDELYAYILRRIMQANRDNDVAVLDEVAGLLREVKTGWDEMPDNQH